MGERFEIELGFRFLRLSTGDSLRYFRIANWRAYKSRFTNIGRGVLYSDSGSTDFSVCSGSSW